MISAERPTAAKPKRVSAKKKLLFATLTVSVFFVGLFLALEIGYRAYRLYRSGPIPRDSFEHTVGWTPRPGKHLSFRAGLKSTTDEAWAEGVDPWYTIDENGFRRRDPATNPGPVVFLIGDSFTEAAYSGTGGTYFDRLAQEVPCRCMPSGAAGTERFRRRWCWRISRLRFGRISSSCSFARTICTTMIPGLRA